MTRSNALIPMLFLVLVTIAAAETKAPESKSRASEKELSRILQDLWSDDDKTSQSAIDRLAVMGERAVEASGAIIANLGDKDLSRKATDALLAIGKASLPELAKAVRTEKGGFEKLEPVKVMARMGQAAVPYLVKLASDKDRMVRLAAAYGLGEITPAGPEVLKTLKRLTKDASALVGAKAMQALRAHEKRDSKFVLPPGLSDKKKESEFVMPPESSSTKKSSESGGQKKDPNK